VPKKFRQLYITTEYFSAMSNRNDLSKQLTSITLLDRSVNGGAVCRKADDA